MSEKLQTAVGSLIETKTGVAARVQSAHVVGGGCINNAQAITLEDGRRFFIKSNTAPLPRMFETEEQGLGALAEAGAIRVPMPIGSGGGKDVVPSFIVLEFIETGQRGRDFFELFGRQFAELHQSAQNDRYGFFDDNYIGATPQQNKLCANWVEFWREQRFGYQFDLARKNGYADSTFNSLADRLQDRLPDLIGEPDEPPCLLHGDLWGGNFMVGLDGQPVLIDPAVYYGRREADLAMTILFGGFDRTFYDAYNETWPLETGSKERLEIYKLYHVLNHLNLFGTSYKSGCLEIMRKYAG